MTASVMRRAFHRLRNGRPGPVLVEIPADVGTQEVPEAAMNYLPPRRMLQAPAASDVKDAVRLLLNAKKPVIWSGMGTLMAEASPELRELSELTEVPVCCTMPGKSGFDERIPCPQGRQFFNQPAGLPMAARVCPPPGPGL
jgi:acetolactate synthase-1/2/3 large subunit